MWKVNYQTLIMMIADQVRYISADEAKKKERKAAGGNSILAQFQTRLKK